MAALLYSSAALSKQKLKTRTGAIAVSMAAASALLCGARASHAANASWLGTTSSAWSVGTNWSGGAAPGTTTGTVNNSNTNGSIATFSGALVGGTRGGAGDPITIDAGRIITGIVFDSANAGAYLIGANNAANTLFLSTGSSIQMTGTVANSEIIANPIQVRAGSSTNGVFSFINNATNSSTIMSFTNPTFTLTNANGRPTTLTLDGTNTGLNIISSNITNAAGIQGVNLINKVNTGTWILTGTNSFTGTGATSVANGIQISNGLLIVENNAALGTNATANTQQVTVSATGILELDNAPGGGGLTLDNGLSLNLGDGGTIRANGVQTTNGRINVNTATLSTTIATVGASDVFTIGNETNDVTGGTANSILHVSGPGQVVLNQPSNYAGSWSLDNGTTTLGNATALGSVATAGVAFGAGSTAKLQLNSNSITVTKLNTNAATPGSAIIENGGGGNATLTVNSALSNSYLGTLRDGVGGGNLALTKSGSGTFALGGNNGYTGNTIINGGTLLAVNSSGSATGPGTVTVNNLAALGGTGSVAGAVTVNSGGAISPGSGGAGTLTISTLDLTPGSVLNYDINSTLSLDQTIVTTSGGLTIDGGKFIFNGGAAPFTTNGVYNLISYAGAISGAGVGALSVGNANTATNTYTFGAAGGYVTLAVASSGSQIIFWNADADGNWSTGPWTGGVTPNAPMALASLGGGGVPITAPRVITVDGAYTVGTLSLNNANFSYTLASGANASITLDNGTTNAFLTDAVGSHTIAAPIIMTSQGASVTVTGANDILTISAPVSGTGAVLTKAGNGTLALLGNNSYTGGTNLNAGVIQVNSATSLGDPAGALAFGGGSVQVAADFTSTRPYQVTGTNNAIVDTNGHNLTLAGAISAVGGGIGGVVKNGNGNLALQGTNTYTGGTTVNAGTLTVSNSASLGDPTAASLLLMGANTTLANSATTALDNGTNLRPVSFAGAVTVDAAPATTLTIGGQLSASAPLLKTDTGTLQLNGSNSLTLTSPITIAGGTIALGGGQTNNQSAIGTTSLIFQGGTLNLNGYNANDPGNALGFGGFTNPVNIAAGQTGTIGLEQRGSFGSAVTGGGTFNLNVEGVRGAIDGNLSAFTGQINVGIAPLVTTGDFRVNNTNGFGTAALNLAAGVNMYMNVNFGTTTLTNSIGELTGTGTLRGGPTAGRTMIWSIGGRNTDFTFGGPIFDNGGPAAITKVGTGKMTVTSIASTYSGGTTVNQGILDASAGTLGTGAITVNPTGTTNTAVDAATLLSSNSIGNSANVTVNSSTTIATAIGTLNESTTAPTWGALSGNGQVNFTSPSAPVALILNANSNASFTGILANAPGGSLSITKQGTGTQTFAGNNTYTGGTVVNNGVLALGSLHALGTAGLTINGGTAMVQAGFTTALRLPSLTVNGGKLDMTDNDLILDYTGSTPVATIAGYLASGFNQGDWTGQGIDSSTANVNVVSLTALGYADVTNISFDGQSIAGSAVIVKYTYYGDSNLDGVVNAGDFSLFLDGLATGGTSWSQGDYTYDNQVDLGNDFNLFLIAYLQNGNALGDLVPIIQANSFLTNAQRASLLAVVPEPSSLTLVSLAACGLASRRRRRQ